MTLTVKTLKHVPIEDVLAPLSEELHDFVIEGLQSTDTSWGSNAETFITQYMITSALENAWEDYLDADFDAEAAEKKNYNRVMAALRKLPKDVFISLGG